MNIDALYADARLARVLEGPGGAARRRPLEVGTRIDESAGVSTELEQRSLLPGARFHGPAHPGAAGETQDFEALVGDELVAHGDGHRHDRNRTRRGAGFLNDLGHLKHGQRGIRGNLQDNGTSHRHRRRELVRREAHRQVEWSDPRHESCGESTSEPESPFRGLVDA